MLAIASLPSGLHKDSAFSSKMLVVIAFSHFYINSSDTFRVHFILFYSLSDAIHDYVGSGERIPFSTISLMPGVLSRFTIFNKHVDHTMAYYMFH